MHADAAIGELVAKSVFIGVIDPFANEDARLNNFIYTTGG